MRGPVSATVVTVTEPFFLVVEFLRRVIHRRYPDLPEQGDEVLHGEAGHLGALDQRHVALLEEMQRQGAVDAVRQKSLIEGDREDCGSAVFGDDGWMAIFCLSQEFAGAQAKVAGAEDVDRVHGFGLQENAHKA